MIRLTINLDTVDQAVDLVDLLLTAAERSERRGPQLAGLWRQLANDLSDGLDHLDQAAADLEAERLLVACGLKARRRPRRRVVRPRDELIDDLAVERVVRGLRPYPVLTDAEVREAARRLTARGASATEIADRTGVERRTVYRWRAADRTASA